MVTWRQDVTSGKEQSFEEREHQREEDDGNRQEDREDDGSGQEERDEEDGSGQEDREEEDESGQEDREEEDGSGQMYREEEDGSEQEDREEEDVSGQEDREEEDGSGQEDREEDDVSGQEDREEDDVSGQEDREEEDGSGQEDREEDDVSGQEDREEEDGSGQMYRDEEDGSEQEDREEDDVSGQEDREEDDVSGQEDREEEYVSGQEDREEDDGRGQEDREDDGSGQEDREEDDGSGKEQRAGEERRQDGNQDSNRSKKCHDDDPVYPGAPLTKGQSLLLLMSYVLRHNLTGVALEDLLAMFNEHFPGLVPATSYLFHKAYGQFGQYVPHFYCIDCESYMGPSETAPKNCFSCRAEFDIEKNLRVGSYFLVLTLSTQIEYVLEKSDTHLNKRESIPGIVSDIQCGAEYEKLKQSGRVGADDISIIWNCDGIPVFNSNNIQIWPIQCQIIELLPKDRQANICIPCLWFGNSKPNMVTFLTAFVSQLKELEENGIKWRDSENIEHSSKVHSLICSSDSVARPLLRNTKQFNGKYGCDFCLHTGGGPYIWETPEPPLRNETDHFQHAILATPANPVMGVKGPSPLMELGSFNMITGFVPEYQHSVCLGVTKQITSLWLDSKHHNKDWYLGSKGQ
ncbi:uncharacterized protein LOC143714556 [Siphateles boraxobius]|uniref:uncharacterized protein LOC143714556 n=1 Tax=Siphateles boraxobius TaxID=180520 RepID=UPI0040630CE0